MGVNLKKVNRYLEFVTERFLHPFIKIAGLPPRQQGLGVPEVWPLGSAGLSSLWTLQTSFVKN